MGGIARLKLLLDTHIWIWSMQGSDRLGKRTAQEIRNPENERWLTPVSTWEALTLHSKGSIHLPEDISAWVARATAAFHEAPLTHEIALAARRLPWDHNDPADRFLAATARVLNLTLVTADTHLLGLGDISTLANR